MIGDITEKQFITKEAVELTDIDYSLFGTLFNLSGSGESTGNTFTDQGDGWDGSNTTIPLLDTLGSLGLTHCSCTPFMAVQMERHLHTQEAQLPTSQPIVFCVAAACDDAPCAADVIPVILRPGYAFVLHRGVWHSSSHGLLSGASYYWSAQVYYNEPTIWREIKNGPLYVRAVF